MKVKADKEGIEALRQLCDIALKFGGIDNLNAVNQFLSGVEPIKEEEE